MQVQRMSKLSRVQLLQADRATVYRQVVPSGGAVWLVQLFCGAARTAFLWGGSGVLMEYPSAAAAVRAVHRVRPDLVVNVDAGARLVASSARSA